VTFKLPTYCYSCGAYLMGGATEHKPGCEVQALIDESLAEAETRVGGGAEDDV
jgi:hypothetical protein